jgi:nucleotide-binding universal stress UspA family protein
MRILVPIVDWPHALAQTNAIAPYRHVADAYICILHVIDLLPLSQERSSRRKADYLAGRASRAEMLTADAAQYLQAWFAEDQIECKILYGSPKMEILQSAQVADLLVLARREKHPLVSLITPSFCTALFKQAKCSLLIPKISLRTAFFPDFNDSTSGHKPLTSNRR